MKNSNAAMVQEIKRYLPLLKDEESLNLLTPRMLSELFEAVTAAGKLIEAVHARKEVEEAVPK